MFENFEERSGTERLSGLFILCFENEQAKKLILEQTVENFQWKTTSMPLKLMCDQK